MLAAFTKDRFLPKLVGMVLVAMVLFAVMPITYAADAATTGSGQTAAKQSTSSSTVTGVPTASDMISNLSKQIPSIQALVTAIAYVLGLVFVLRGIMRLKHVGEMRTMMSHEHSLKGPIVFICVGAALLYFPTTLNVGLSTFWTAPNPYGYVIAKDQWTQFFGTCLSIVQLFGVIAFIRGLVMLAQLAGQGGGHQGGLGKSLTHIIGGIFCINIYQFVQVVMVTLGIQSPFN